MLDLRRFGFLPLLGISFFAIGCDRDVIVAPAAQQAAQQSATASMEQNLEKFHSAYLDYHDTHGKGPASWDELKSSVPESQSDRLAAIQAVQDAGYAVTWGLEAKAMTDGMSNTVVAQGGGPTLYFDGSVR